MLGLNTLLSLGNNKYSKKIGINPWDCGRIPVEMKTQQALGIFLYVGVLFGGEF